MTRLLKIGMALIALGTSQGLSQEKVDIAAALFFVVALVFVYRSFYGMRIKA